MLQRAIYRGIVGRQVGEIDLFAVMLADQVERILDHRHHAETQQIDFNDAHVGAVVFIPLHDHTAGHGGRLERHNGIELPLADHHAARVLAQVARQVLHSQIQLEKFADARVAQIQAGIAELALGRVFRIFPFPRAHQAGELLDRCDLEPQRLAHLARRRTAAIRDDVGGHGRAQLAVAIVDVLDDALALVARRQVDIDIRPLAALLREETLEQQLHGDRIDRRDAQRITDGAIGGRAAPLRENPVFPAELDDVPDDEKVTGELQFFDQRQLALDLPPCFFVIRQIAAPGAFLGALAQKRHHGLARRDRVAWKLVTQIGERKIQTRGNLSRVGDGFGQVGKQAGHFRRGFQVPLGVALEQAARGGERDVLTHTSQHVERFPLFWCRLTDAIGGHQRHAQPARGGNLRLVARFFFAMEMTLDFSENIGAAEGLKSAIERFGRRREADQPLGKLGHLLRRGRALAFFGAQFHAGDQTAEVPITGAVFGEQGILEAVRAGDLRADMRPDAGLGRRHVKARRAIDAVPIHQRHRRIAEAGRGLGQLFRQRRALQKTEGRVRVQLDIGLSHNCPR